MKKYFNYTVKNAVTVTNLITLEYLDLSSSFIYPEEVHKFFEFAYVDKGSLSCNMDGEIFNLSKDDFIFIPPNHKHYYSIKNHYQSSVFIVCFSSNSNIIEILKGVTLLEKTQTRVVAKILSESQKAFQFPFDKKLELISKPVFGAQQMIKNAIEELLIDLVRIKLSDNKEIKLVMSGIELENSLIEDIVFMLKKSVYGELSLDDICKKTFYSKTYLNKLFNKNLGTSIIQYYINLKIEESKKLLKSGLTVNEVSDKLYFNSPNYFSKAFRKHCGVSPTEYKKSVK